MDEKDSLVKEVELLKEENERLRREGEMSEIERRGLIDEFVAERNRYERRIWDLVNTQRRHNCYS